MEDDDTTRAGGSEGASAPSRVGDAPRISLENAWRRWASASRAAPPSGHRAAADVLAEALDRASTSEILELFVRGVDADVHDSLSMTWFSDREPLAAEIDRRIPRRRA
jgi:hypothetical protein